MLFDAPGYLLNGSSASALVTVVSIVVFLTILTIQIKVFGNVTGYVSWKVIKRSYFSRPIERCASHSLKSKSFEDLFTPNPSVKFNFFSAYRTGVC